MPPPQVERAKRALAAPGGKTLAAGQQSDHLLVAAAYGLWRAARQEGAAAAFKVARERCLSVQTLEQLAEMRAQFAAMLADIRCAAGIQGRLWRGGGDAHAGWLLAL